MSGIERIKNISQILASLIGRLEAMRDLYPKPNEKIIMIVGLEPLCLNEGKREVEKESQACLSFFELQKGEQVDTKEQDGMRKSGEFYFCGKFGTRKKRRTNA